MGLLGEQKTRNYHLRKIEKKLPTITWYKLKLF